MTHSHGLTDRDAESLTDAIEALEDAGFTVESVGKMVPDSDGVYLSLGVTTPNRVKQPEGGE